MQVFDFTLAGVESRFLKTATLFAVLLLGTAGVLVFLMTEEVTQHLELSLQRDAEVRAYQLTARIEEIVLADGSQGVRVLETEGEKLEADLNAIYGQDASYLFCLVENVEGRVVFKDSMGTLPSEVYRRVDFQTPNAWQNPVVVEYLVRHGDEEKRVYQVSVAIVMQEQFWGVLKLGVSLQALNEQIESLANTLIRRHMLGGILFVLIGGLAVWQTVRLMREAHRLEMQAKETDRLVFLGTIASGLAHEIRNPLNAISVDSELLAEVADELDAEKCDEIVKLSLDIGDSVRYLNATLSGFLQFARPSSLSLVRVKPKSLVLETVRLVVRQCARQGILLEWDAPEEVPDVDVDVPQIKQALLNLLINAQQAMPDGGVLAVHIRVEEDGVWIDVSDTGDGIPEAEQERVFNLFYTNKTGGSGLGLAIARRIVELHGGRLMLHCQEGEGATFAMRLPISEGAGS